MEEDLAGNDLRAAGVVQHAGPVHQQPHSRTTFKEMLCGEANRVAANFYRFAYADGVDARPTRIWNQHGKIG